MNYPVTASVSVAPLSFSGHAQRAADQAISFLMQQAVENPGCISLAAGLVDEQTLPAKLALSAASKLLSDEFTGRRMLQYGTTNGPEDIRQTIRSYVAELEHCPDGLADLPTDQIVMTTGSQQLLSLVTQALFEPGDICLVAAPTYFVYLSVLEAVGAEIIPVDSDEHGMCADALNRTLAQLEQDGRLHRVKLVYVISYYDNPSGISATTERRPQLLQAVRDWSKDSRILLLEDAAYRELHYSGEVFPSIWSLDTDRHHVILAQTFSKSFSPGVRVGFGILPQELVKPVCDLKGNDDFGSGHFSQNLVAQVIRSGDYRKHVLQVRDGYRQKRDAMLDAAQQHFSDIPGVSWVHPDGGMYVWMTLPDSIATGFDSDLFRYATQSEKVMYVPGELGYPKSWAGRPRNQMRLAFGVQSIDGIRQGMERLSRAVRFVLSDS